MESITFKKFIDLYGIKKIDWGPGDARFKKYLSNLSFNVGTIYIFSSSIYGFLLNLGKLLLTIFKNICQFLLQKLDFKEKASKIYS